MIESYKIDFDATDALRKLDLVKKDMNKIARRMMGKVFTEIKKESKKQIRGGQTLHKRSGYLLKMFKHKTKNDFSGWVANESWHAATHEYGATLFPKEGKYMIFKINEEWKKVTQVSVPKRPFLGNVVDDYFFSSSKAEDVMDEILQKALTEIFATN